MSTEPIVILPPKTRRWAISAVVLGALVFVLGLQNVFNYHKSVMMFGSGKAVVTIIMSIVDEIIAALFVAAGAAVLKGRSWGREGLTYASAGAIVMTALGSVWSWITLHDPGFAAAFTKSPGASTLPPNFVNMIVLISSIMTILVSAGEIAYCVCLYRHMSAEPIDEPPVDYAAVGRDVGAWPPPPAQ